MQEKQDPTSEIQRRKTDDLAKLQARQRDFCGNEFVGATLSSIRAPDWAQRKVVDWMKEPKRFLVYFGGPGIGKTYLCASLMEWALKKFQTFRYYNERKLLSTVRESVSSGNGDYLITLKNLLDDQFIMIDDIGSSGVNEWREEVLFEAIDMRYSSLMPTLITSNFTLKEFQQKFHPRFCSRMFSKENVIIDGEGFIDHRQQ